MVWLDVPLEEVTPVKILEYIDHLLDKRLHPGTINYHLLSIRRFYDYLAGEEGVPVKNPVKTGYGLRLPKPLPRCLKEEDLATLFRVMQAPPGSGHLLADAAQWLTGGRGGESYPGSPGPDPRQDPGPARQGWQRPGGLYQPG